MNVSNKRRRKPKGSAKRSTFKRSLTLAEVNLAAALAEQAEARETLTRLSSEIPALQRTIAALQAQLNPQPKVQVTPELFIQGKETVYRVENDGQLTDLGGNVDYGQQGPQPKLPEPPTEIKFMRDGVEVSVPVVPQDLSGMGSLRPGQPEVIPAATETELPEPEGVPLAGE